MILTVSPTGELTLPAELVPAEPNTQVQAERQGSFLRVNPVTASELPPQGSAAFWEDFLTFPAGPVDATVTFRREDLYNDFQHHSSPGSNG